MSDKNQQEKEFTTQVSFARSPPPPLPLLDMP